MATYFSLNTSSARPASVSQVVFLIYTDVVLLLILTLLIGQRLLVIWVERRRGIAGSRLHARISMIFGFLVVTPATITALFSILSFYSGLESWLNDNNRSVLSQARAVALAYLDEHKKVIQADAEAIANQLAFELPALIDQAQSLPNSFNRALDQRITDLAEMRNVAEVILFDEGGELLGRSHFTFALEFERINFANLAQVLLAPVVTTSNEGDRVRALVGINSNPPLYLYVGRLVDAKILNYIKATNSAVDEYNQLEQNRNEVRTMFAVIFVLVSLLLVFLAIWLGLMFADQIARPISHLIIAAEAISLGNLSVDVPVDNRQPEIGMLSTAFNRMISQLAGQRKALVSTNRQLEQRNQFIESVLAGITSGVIKLNPSGDIDLANKAASEIIGIDLEQKIGENIINVIPEFQEIINKAKESFSQIVSAEITRENHQNLMLRVVAARYHKEIQGYVLNFVDITDSLANQRKAAWSDIARRMAHEIKNPLTPIQLAANRLKRKYLDAIPKDKEIFSDCVDTIVQQVSDIRLLVDEFSAFARMPQANKIKCNITDLCKQAVFLQQHAATNIKITLHHTQTIQAECDPNMISQALNNLLINSIQAIQEVQQTNPQYQGVIDIKISSGDDQPLMIQVIDNGIGLPNNLRKSLTDPYVTSKAKGTGLGLAIVKKIMEEHNGKVILEDNPANTGGAVVSLLF